MLSWTFKAHFFLLNSNILWREMSLLHFNQIIHVGNEAKHRTKASLQLLRSGLPETLFSFLLLDMCGVSQSTASLPDTRTYKIHLKFLPQNAPKGTWCHWAQTEFSKACQQGQLMHGYSSWLNNLGRMTRVFDFWNFLAQKLIEVWWFLCVQLVEELCCFYAYASYLHTSLLKQHAQNQSCFHFVDGRD